MKIRIKLNRNSVIPGIRNSDIETNLALIALSIIEPLKVCIIAITSHKSVSLVVTNNNHLPKTISWHFKCHDITV